MYSQKRCCHHSETMTISDMVMEEKISMAKHKRSLYMRGLVLLSLGCLTFTLVLVFFSLELWVSGYLKYDCEVNNITYPEKIPYIGNTNNNWNKCDCEAWEPCITLFASVSKSESIREIKNDYFHPQKCTFMDNDCECCSHNNNYSIVLLEVEKKVTSYMNSKIDCFWDGKDDYFYLDYDKTNLYFVFAFLLAIVLGFTITFIIIYRKMPVIPNRDMNANYNV